MKKFVVALTVLALCSVSFAQSPSLEKVTPQQETAAAAAQERAAQEVPYSPLATTSCTYTFTSGAGNTYLKYCVTVNGNITQIQTPFGHEHIAVGTIGEGYGICNVDFGVVEYHDWAGFGDSGNWGSPTTVSHTATAVKIARTTSDGVWTLTQTIIQAASTASVKVVMALKNNTSVARTVYLVRYADVSADSRFLNNFDATQNTAAGWNSNVSSNPYGLVLQNVTTSPFAYQSAFTQNTFAPPNACAFAFNSTNGVATGINGSVEMAYVDVMPANGSKTVTLAYKGM
jgi:hypothetical protein